MDNLRWTSRCCVDWEHEHGSRRQQEVVSHQRRDHSAGSHHESDLRNTWPWNCFTSHCEFSFFEIEVVNVQKYKTFLFEMTICLHIICNKGVQMWNDLHWAWTFGMEANLQVLASNPARVFETSPEKDFGGDVREICRSLFGTCKESQGNYGKKKI